MAARTSPERLVESLKSPLWKSLGGTSARDWASSSAWVENPVFSSEDVPVVSRPHSKVARLTSVTVGNAATPVSGLAKAAGTISAQPKRSGLANNSRKILVLRPSTTSNSTGRSAANGATTRSSTDSKGTIRPSGPGACAFQRCKDWANR